MKHCKPFSEDEQFSLFEIAGFIEAARKRFICIPSIWGSAVPGGIVSKEAFETICAMLCYNVTAALPNIDAVYLDLHGAMVMFGLKNDFLKSQVN